MSKMDSYDVVVIGTGHAGAEAALAAARLGCKVLALTLNLDNIGLMPCNPAIGGPGKAQLVREIDALGGEMARAIDDTFIQIRMLNTSKGPAVRSLRAQADKRAYQARMRSALERQEGLHLRQALVDEIVVADGKVTGVRTKTGIFYQCAVVVLTGGVYLNGRVITGDYEYESGPNGQLPAKGLSSCLRALGLRIGRFKTGTPPRIDGDTLRRERMSRQEGDKEARAFSFMSWAEDPERLPGEAAPPRRQLPCWLTHTNQSTHDVIRANLHRAPLFSGRIEGRGPRYCPSVEDKIVRFADKTSHQVFIEPEGWDTREMYVLGLSTSLPEDVQIDMLRTIPGLEEVRLLRPGYAIEYDYLDARQFEPWLESKHIEGLFAAGQVLGSSGYEEAAAQGLLAGVNAARHVRGEEQVTLSRSQAYIGVLIDDLVVKGTDEPYRMLTSRAEHRLLLRQDNADLRLTELGYRWGLASRARYYRMIRKRKGVEGELERLRSVKVTPSYENNAWLESAGTSPLTQTVTLQELLRRPEVGYANSAAIDEGRSPLGYCVTEQVEIRIKYEGYIAKQEDAVRRLDALEERLIPRELDFRGLRGLSLEAQDRLSEVRPRTIGQATRMGISPSDISVLLVHLQGRTGLRDV